MALTDEGFWKLSEKPCVAFGYAIVFDEKGAVIYDGPLAGMSAKISDPAVIKGIEDVWLNPKDVRLFVGWAAAKGYLPEKIQ